ncbi:FMC1 protein family [Drechmeria coniospora]|uniref:FMC1 protein family n=1 Tax=Drechmeria coniospora TaxID=98403 RepID=A0A151GDA5_DRECN|nr:FMC1 protein family [Drechmeria coniospora]KYK55077.1 FMC1 protein family [Drechmeria coniospora]
MAVNTTTSAIQLRSLYRALLRELPPRPILANPRSALHSQIRASFASNSIINASDANHRYAEAEQAVIYLRSQRKYVTLLERYNPGMDMDDEERVRLSARRMGMNLPKAFME